MSIETYSILAGLCEDLNNRRLHLALRAPDVSHCDDCDDHRVCSNIWEETWLSIVGHKLLHAVDIYRPPLSDIKICAKSLIALGMHLPCYKTVIPSLQHHSSSWNFEEIMTENAIKALMVEELNLVLPLNGTYPLSDIV
jgi:hypothetical protein